MNPKVKQIIIFSSLIIVGSYFLVLGAYKAKSFLIPLTIAILLSMVMLPASGKLEGWGISRGFAVLVSDLVIVGFCAGLFFIVGTQINSISENWSKYEKQLKPRIEQLQQYVEKKTGIPPEKQISQLKDSFKGVRSQSGKTVGKFLSVLLSTFGNFMLVFVYIFFFMYYRAKFRTSILKFFPEEQRKKADKILKDFTKVSQQYLFGRFLLIIFLAALYAVGLSITGIKHAILISILAAVLSLIPYIGNIIGIGIAILFGLITQGGATVLIGIAITFGIAQFVESYILEPYVVGNRVDLNPAFTIIGVVAGGAVWGVAGLIIAIPLLGIFKAVFDQIAVLNPMGYLLGEEGLSSGGGWIKKIKGWFQS